MGDMSVIELIDTFPTFLTYWAEVRHKALDEQIESWATEYMAQWPDLLAKLTDDYSTQGLDWRKIAREKVFPYLTERLPSMQQARRNLLKLCAPIYSRAKLKLSFDSNVVFVIYVGIGCGAGWATTFRDLPAILFGLENIAECGWSGGETIAGLVAHEIGHLVHYHWRNRNGKPMASGPWWQLYEEGFAQYCESLLLDSGIWHQMKDDDWFDWCQRHKSWLAAEFMRTVEVGKSVSSFFGSWFEICGRRETGYFLGYEVISELTKRFDLKEIALLDHVEVYLQPVLIQMMKNGG